MTRYLVRRLAFALVLVAAVSSASFLLARLAPGDFVTETLGTQASRDEIARERARFGLDRSIAAHYRDWAAAALRLDFGPSMLYGRPVRCKRCGTPFVASPSLDGAAAGPPPLPPADPFPILPAEFGRYKVLRLLGLTTFAGPPVDIDPGDLGAGHRGRAGLAGDPHQLPGHRAHATDRRVRTLWLTPLAWEVVDRILAINAEVREEACAGLSPAAREALMAALDHMKSNLLSVDETETAAAE